MSISMSRYWSSLELIPYIGYWKTDDSRVVAFGFLFWEIAFDKRLSFKEASCMLYEMGVVTFAFYKLISITTPKLHITFPHRMPYNGEKLGGAVDLQVLNLGVHL